MRSILISLIIVFSSCDLLNKNSEEENQNLLSLLIASNIFFSPSNLGNLQNRIPVTSCSIVKSSPVELQRTISVSNTIKNKDLCYFSFTPATTSNYTITLTPNSNTDNLPSDSDLAANLVSNTGGNKPTNFWTGTGVQCTSFGWEHCVHNTGLTSESLTLVGTAGQIISIGIYGFDCSNLDGCKFSLIVN